MKQAILLLITNVHSIPTTNDQLNITIANEKTGNNLYIKTETKKGDKQGRFKNMQIKNFTNMNNETC